MSETKKHKHPILTLRNDQTIIKNIYHLSDIHIKDSDSYTVEYNLVFDKLYNIIKSDPLRENSIAVITGDIMHNKCFYSNYSIDMFYSFMESLSKLLDVIVICGNCSKKRRKVKIDFII